MKLNKYFFLLFFVSCFLFNTNSAFSETAGRQEYEGEIRIQLAPEEPSDEPILYTWPVPKEWSTQRVVEILLVDPPPEREVIERFHGSLLYQWNLPGDEETEIVVQFRWRALSENLSLDPAKVLEYEKEDEILRTAFEGIPGWKFTRGELDFIEWLNHNESNPLLKARRIFEAMSREGGLLYDPAATSEKSSLRWTALCRAAGVPARPVSGYLIFPDKSTRLHSWAEFYVAPYGWVPVDPWTAVHPEIYDSWSEWSTPEEYYFGRFGADRLILAKGGFVRIPPLLKEATGLEGIEGKIFLNQEGFCSRPQDVRMKMDLEVELLQP
jgi:hypothetical protein